MWQKTLRWWECLQPLVTVLPLCLLLGPHMSGIIGLNKRCVKSVMSCRRSEEL